MVCRRVVGLLILALLTAAGLLAGLVWPLHSARALPTPPPTAPFDRPPPPPQPQREYPLPPPAALRPTADTLPPDLSILTIGRTPRYPRYCLDYTYDVPMLCPGTETTQRFPAAGETAVFHARLANQGGQPAPAVPYTWTLDGVVQAAGLTPALEPGAEYTLTWTWAW
ncbi:MAG: hypothetical protein NZP34_04020, partial [Caldilineales bacterium]|nr:hypothetical protein [Caldilineales bacterium]